MSRAKCRLVNVEKSDYCGTVVDRPLRVTHRFTPCSCSRATASRAWTRTSARTWATTRTSRAAAASCTSPRARRSPFAVSALANAPLPVSFERSFSSTANQYRVQLFSSPTLQPVTTQGKIELTLVGSNSFNETFSLTK